MSGSHVHTRTSQKDIISAECSTENEYRALKAFAPIRIGPEIGKANTRKSNSRNASDRLGPTQNINFSSGKYAPRIFRISLHSASPPISSFSFFLSRSMEFLRDVRDVHIQKPHTVSAYTLTHLSDLCCHHRHHMLAGCSCCRVLVQKIIIDTNSNKLRRNDTKNKKKKINNSNSSIIVNSVFCVVSFQNLH